MKVFVFLGPTMSVDDARKELEATYLPPVAQGDLYRAAKEKPFAIGVVDGYFERLPAVWHKEILWALSQRIHVFGAASMGALRAAELARFGMQGVGEIYKAFASGELEDDDEVAVAHGDASSGFRALSEAMVNIRATLAHAEAKGAIPADLRCRLEALAKKTFYPERSFPHLLARVQKDGLQEQVLETLRTFLPANRVDQKRLDARLLLRAIRDCCAAGEAPKPPVFSFQHTEAWDQVVDWAEGQPPIHLETTTSPVELLAAEVRLLGEKGRAILAGGYARLAGGVLARRRGVADAGQRIDKLDQALREQSTADGNGGQDEGQFGRWLEAHGLTRETYASFLERQVELDWLKERHHVDLERYVVDELRQSGDYAEVARRAANKERVLTQSGLQAPTLRDAELTQSQLFNWYCERRLGRRPPKDIKQLLADYGIASATALEQEALREFLYARLVHERNVEDLDNGDDSGKPQRRDTLS